MAQGKWKNCLRNIENHLLTGFENWNRGFDTWNQGIDKWADNAKIFYTVDAKSTTSISMKHHQRDM